MTLYLEAYMGIVYWSKQILLAFNRECCKVIKNTSASKQETILLSNIVTRL